MLKIPNIFHIIYDKDNYKDIEVYIFFSIKSFIEINRPNEIYFHYISIPNGYLWNKIKDNLILKKIIVPKKYENNKLLFIEKYKYVIIYKKLIDYGGIYLDINSISINPINNLLKYNFVKSKNNEIICSEKNSSMANKYFDFYLNNKLFEEIFEDNNYLIDNLNYDNSDNSIDNILFHEIYDYSFGTYFHLIKNCYFLSFSNNKKLNNITIFNIFNKITIYNLLVRYSISYNLFYNNTLNINTNNYTNNYINNYTNNYTNNYKLLNNIDIIFWINLEESVDRKNKMIDLLNKFDIKNIRVNAVNGNLINDINYKYFYNSQNNYPKYLNKEYAILLSHLNTIESFINNYNNLKYGVALICEDDLSFDFMNYWNKDIKTIIEEAPKDWDIIMLGYFSLNLNNNELYKKWDNEWSAMSYLVNHKSMIKIKELKKDDKWICKDTDLMVSDNYIFSKFNTYIYKYPYFTFSNDNDSTFHEDHIHYHKIYKMSNYIIHENIYNEYVQ